MTTDTEQKKVVLVGAGPGDPDLITVKGLQWIQKADTLVYDYLASEALLGHAKKGAECIYVGKKGGDHTLSQEKITRLIIDKAISGKLVVRLKGGDPFIFGRGGEEVEELARENIPFEIVPGVTSPISAAAYAGIPLTHRDYTSTVAFVTGHEDPKKTESGINWKTLAEGIGTIVFLMGMKNIGFISNSLLENGKHPDTPVAVIRWGTTTRQKTLVGTLKDIAGKVEAEKLKPPAIIVVGEVVRLRETLNWYENRPLWGKRIVVTRAREQASGLSRKLTRLGAECLECPVIRIVEPDDLSPLDQAIDIIETYDWIIFTSVNGVEHFFKRLFAKGRDVRSLRRIRTASIGPATAAKLEEYGFHSDIIPSTYQAESVITAFQEANISGKQILIPRAKEARHILPEELRKMGGIITEVPAYQTIRDESGAGLLLSRLREKTVDMVTFTSSSTVTNFKALLPTSGTDFLQGVKFAAIGPITAETAKNLGFTPHIIAETYTIPGLIEAICRVYEKE